MAHTVARRKRHHDPDDGLSVFVRLDDAVFHTYSAYARGTEGLTDAYSLLDRTPYGRQEDWEDSPSGWPQRPTYSGWLDSPDIARCYGKDSQ